MQLAGKGAGGTGGGGGEWTMGRKPEERALRALEARVEEVERE